MVIIVYLELNYTLEYCVCGKYSIRNIHLNYSFMDYHWKNNTSQFQTLDIEIILLRIGGTIIVSRLYKLVSSQECVKPLVPGCLLMLKENTEGNLPKYAI